MDREERVRSYYRALDDHDYGALAAVLAPGFRHVRPDRTFEGRERFVRFMREERPQSDTSHPLDALYADGDGVAAEGRLLDADGEPIAAFVDVFSFEGNSIAEVRTYTR